MHKIRFAKFAPAPLVAAVTSLPSLAWAQAARIASAASQPTVDGVPKQVPWLLLVVAVIAVIALIVALRALSAVRALEDKQIRK